MSVESEAPVGSTRSGDSHVTDQELDEIDEQILSILQDDARNNTNTLIGERVGVSPSTVGKRIKELERSGIIKGYKPDIDYDEAAFPLRVLFICTTGINERSDLIEEARSLRGVVSVRELMTGKENVHIEVVGQSNQDITHMATAIDSLGIDINEEILVKNEFHDPASVFRD